jgi:hypothetical protein
MTFTPSSGPETKNRKRETERSSSSEQDLNKLFQQMNNICQHSFPSRFVVHSLPTFRAVLLTPLRAFGVPRLPFLINFDHDFSGNEQHFQKSQKVRCANMIARFRARFEPA